MTTQFKSLIHLLDHFKEESTCIEYLAKSRWDNAPCCPHCGGVKAYVTNRGYKCADKDCHKKFTVTTGTIFENTKISLRYWYAAIYLSTAHKKGISSLQLSRDLNITQKTAWFLLHRVREMLSNNTPELLRGTVEADETVVGGKTGNKVKSHRNKVTSGLIDPMANKSVVMGMVQRGEMLQMKVLKSRGEILPTVIKNIDKEADLITDSSGVYKSVNKIFPKHQIIDHSKDEYVRGSIHTNTIEGVFSLFDRMVIGIYHFVSPKHLQRYCDEFTYRYNSRNISDGLRFEDAIKRVNNVRLTYDRLIS